jgi:NAD(P)-dependent dehydrogenase (short-subunit alcohol dehydrogenase family)
VTGRFEGRGVLVTGGAHGIGRGIVEAFLESGAHVFATDLDAAALTAIHDEHANQPLHVHTADLADVAQVRAIVPAAAEALGAVDVLVNDAGVQPDGPALDVAPQQLDVCFAVNVRAPFFLMQDVARHLMDRGVPGSIVNITSANAVQNESPESIYNASKAALGALTTAFAHELGHVGIRVNAVAPGETITPEFQAELDSDPEARASVHRYLGRIPLRRAGTPRDQAMAVLFLAGDDAAFVTGQTLIVDGGEVGGGSWYDDALAPPLPPQDRPLTGG